MRLTAVLCLLALAGISFSAVPSWVQPGVSATYDGISAAYSNGQPQNGVQTLVVLTVNSVSGNTVSGTTVVSMPSMPAYSQTYSWVCVDGGKCDWRFWVDPGNPTSSVKGPNGEPYTNGGALPYNFNGYSDPEGALMYYQNDQTNVEYHLAFNSRTGLILSYAEVYPTQHTYLYLKSISRDLSGYHPSAQTPQPDGNGGNRTGAGVCGGLFAALAMAGVGMIVRHFEW